MFSYLLVAVVFALVCIAVGLLTARQTRDDASNCLNCGSEGSCGTHGCDNGES